MRAIHAAHRRPAAPPRWRFRPAAVPATRRDPARDPRPVAIPAPAPVVLRHAGRRPGIPTGPSPPLRTPLIPPFVAAPKRHRGPAPAAAPGSREPARSDDGALPPTTPVPADRTTGGRSRHRPPAPVADGRCGAAPSHRIPGSTARTAPGPRWRRAVESCTAIPVRGRAPSPRHPACRWSRAAGRGLPPRLRPALRPQAAGEAADRDGPARGTATRPAAASRARPRTLPVSAAAPWKPGGRGPVVEIVAAMPVPAVTCGGRGNAPHGDGRGVSRPERWRTITPPDRRSRLRSSTPGGHRGTGPSSAHVRSAP